MIVLHRFLKKSTADTKLLDDCIQLRKVGDFSAQFEKNKGKQKIETVATLAKKICTQISCINGLRRRSKNFRLNFEFRRSFFKYFCQTKM